MINFLMRKEHEVQNAIIVLKERSHRLGQKKSRIHQDSQFNRVAAITALEGQCGSCEYLRLRFYDLDTNAKSVSVNCSVQNSPIELHNDIFEIKACEDHVSGIND